MNQCHNKIIKSKLKKFNLGLPKIVMQRKKIALAAVPRILDQLTPLSTLFETSRFEFELERSIDEEHKCLRFEPVLGESFLGSKKQN